MTMDEPLLHLKGRFPFRLGTTSYIIPADILPNVEFLVGLVDDVELVLFESAATSNLPGPAAIGKLGAVARAEDLTYTVHLPLDAPLGLPQEAARRESVERCLRVMELARPLDPFAWVVHFDPPEGGQAPADWLAALRASIGELLATGVEAPRICVENLTYPFEDVERIVLDHGLSVCLDIGHLVLEGRDVVAFLDRHLGRTRVVHLHGIVDGKDHRDVGALDPALLAALMERLADEGAPERVVTLEVFSRPDFEASLSALKGWAR